MAAGNKEHAVLMEIVKRVKEINQGDGKKPGVIPTSDDMYRKHLSDIVESKDKLEFYVRLLFESHYLLQITLVEADERLLVNGIHGYVVAEAGPIDSLIEFYDTQLETAYEQHFYRRRAVATIIRELLPQARTFNNTDLGRALNVSVMLHQFAQLLRAEYAEFTDMFKRRKLQEIMPDLVMGEEEHADDEDGLGMAGTADSAADIDAVESAPEIMPQEAGADAIEVQAGIPSLGEEDPDSDAEALGAAPPPEPAPITPAKRAVDTVLGRDVQQMDKSGRWGEAVNRYGVEFLVRIHLRKYEFEKLRWLIRSGRIVREQDLRFIRDSLRKMEGRFNEDPALNRYSKDMAEVKRAAQVRLNAIHQMKKQ